MEGGRYLMLKQISLEESTYKKFQAALVLTGESEELVIKKLISEYANAAFESVMDSKLSSREEENITSADEQKKLFTNWFRSLTRNGKPYNPVTISGYTGRIENVCSNPAFDEIPVDNLFSITDLAEFTKIRSEIIKSEEYADMDAKSHNGLTAALRKYEEFLEFQASGNMYHNSALVNKPYYVKPSSIHRWTFDEDKICCKRFLEYYVIKKSDMDTAEFIDILGKEVPDVSSGSLRMKIQNIKYLTNKAGFEDSSTLTCLSQHSMQCERAFKNVLQEMNL